MKRATSRLILQTLPTAVAVPFPTPPIAANHVKLGYQAIVRTERPNDNPYDHPIPVHLNGSSFYYFITTTQPHFNCVHAVKGITTAPDGASYYDNIAGSLAVRAPSHTRILNVRATIDLDVKTGERSGIMSATIKAFHDQDEIARQIRSMYCIRVEDLIQLPGSKSSETFHLTVDHSPPSTNLWSYGFQPPNKIIGVLVFSCDLETKEAGVPSAEINSFKVILDYDYEFYNIGEPSWYYISPMFTSQMPDCTLYYEPRRFTASTSHFLYGLDLVNLDKTMFTIAHRGDATGRGYNWGYTTLCVQGNKLSTPTTMDESRAIIEAEISSQKPAITVIEITAKTRAIHTSAVSSDRNSDDEYEVV